MAVTQYSRRGAVAVIQLNNPPVNGLAHALRAGIAAGLQEALNDAEVKAIVLIGAGKMFCAGAEIREFNTPAATSEPTLRTVVKQIEAAPKPVVAAIHGTALGGGLELALACHYRVAAPKTQLGLPEVKLGILPGGGGTQRLPRLIGVEAALPMIVSGDPIDSAKSKQLGLVDELVEGDLLAGAVAFAERVAASRTEHPIAAQRAAKLDNATAFFAAARAQAAKEKRGFPAPLECIACVEAAVNLPIDEGLKFERERFLMLVNGVESKALRHLFFAERQAAKVPDVPGDTPVRPIKHAGILGAGTMGGGIAMSFANAGIPVSLLEVKQEALDKGLGAIRKNYAASVAKGRLSQEAMDRRLGLITGILSYDDFKDVDLAIEAVFEDMAVKKEVFARLDAVCKPSAILATNTSRLDVNEIAASSARPQDVIGLHFFSPANVMRLLEVVRGAKTAPDVIATSMQLAKTLKKLAVLVGVCEGFVGNRMLSPYRREAEFLLEEGASPQQVDQALYKFGMAMGPFTMADMAGLDIGWAARKRLEPTRPAHLRYSKVGDRICELGRFGQKTGAGFYRYEAGSRTPLPDPEIDALIEQCAQEAGIGRRAIADEEIIERTIYALINEGAKILEEGIALRASDIDLVYVNGYGFPAWRGGPMFYADTVGLDKVYGKIRELYEKHGEYWTPAPLLRQLAEAGKRFNP